MARRRRIALFLCTCVVVGLVDCSPPPVTQTCVPAQSGGFGTGGGAAGEPIFVTGMPAELVLESFVSSTCEPKWTVEGEVLDPQNLAVPAELSRLEGFGGMANARVRFTPQVPGSYLVTARFEPSIARVQRVVKVARNRLAAPTLIDALPFDPSVCRQVSRTLQGGVVCQRGGTAIVVRSGAVLESFPDTTANVVGNTVWLVRRQTLERRVDTGSGPLAFTGSIVAKVQLSASDSFFDEDRAIVSDGSTLRGPLVWDGAQLVDEARPFFGDRGLLLGGLAVFLGSQLVCEASVDAGVCTRLTPVGVERDVLWSWEQGQPLSYRVGGHAAPPSVFPIGLAAVVDPLEFPVSGSQTPRIRENGQLLYTVTFSGDGPVLERWPWETRFTRDFALVSTTSGTVTWVKR